MNGLPPAFLVAMGLAVVEALAYYVAPQWLARLALIPIGSPREARIPRAMLDQNQAPALYRSSARAPLTMDRLPLPSHIAGSDTVGGWADGYGWLRLTTKWFGWNRSLGVARLRVDLRGDTVRLDARMYPMPVAMIVLIPMLFVMGRGPGLGLMMFGVFAIAIGVNWGMSYFRIRDDVDAALIQISSAIEHPPRY
jgi:hypothetical protein